MAEPRYSLDPEDPTIVRRRMAVLVNEDGRSRCNVQRGWIEVSLRRVRCIEGPEPIIDRQDLAIAALIGGGS